MWVLAMGILGAKHFGRDLDRVTTPLSLSHLLLLDEEFCRVSRVRRSMYEDVPRSVRGPLIYRATIHRRVPRYPSKPPNL